MHLVCLGTVRKLILLWIKGLVGIRYPTWKTKEISNFIQNIKKKTYLVSFQENRENLKMSIDGKPPNFEYFYCILKQFSLKHL